MLGQPSLKISLIKIIQSFIVTFATVLIVSCGGDGNSGSLLDNNDRDADDVFPEEPSQSVDTDGDGNSGSLPDNNDRDADDVFPEELSQSVDTDGDGALDYEDPFPLDATVAQSKKVPAEIGILR